MKEGKEHEAVARQLYLERIFRLLKMPYQDRRRFLQLASTRERSFRDWKTALLELTAQREREKILSVLWPEEEAERYVAQGLRVASPGDRDWPKLLSDIPDPPLWIWYRGQPPSSFDRLLPFALVGSRKAGAYARKAAYELSALAVQRGHAVISGLARGLDGWAHRCVLDFGGKTAAVLPCGLNRCYPPEHKALLAEIQAEGFALSEFPPDYPLLRENFHSRNRLIAGLSLALFVLQGAEKSGTLITARFAAEQGREIFVLPGSLYAPEYRGSNQLIADGANILYDYRQLRKLPLPEGGSEVPDEKRAGKIENSKRPSRNTEEDTRIPEISRKKELGRRSLPPSLDGDERRLLKNMGSSVWETEELARLLGISWQELRIALVRLELKGCVKRSFDRFVLTEAALSCIYND